MSTAKYLDLDAIAEESQFTFKLNGKEHQMRVATVATFAESMREIQTLALDASVESELEVIVRLVKRAFPTMSNEEVQNLTLPQLRHINDFVFDAIGGNGTMQSKDAQGN